LCTSLDQDSEENGPIWCSTGLIPFSLRQTARELHHTTGCSCQPIPTLKMAKVQFYGTICQLARFSHVSAAFHWYNSKQQMGLPLLLLYQSIIVALPSGKKMPLPRPKRAFTPERP
jgi:hypothetical protein